MQSTIPATNNSLRLPSIVDPSTDQIILRGRVKSPADLKSAWDSLWWADLDSARARMAAQQWRDGIPPYSVRRETLMGTAGRTNVNWGLGDQIATDAEMPYNDILDGVDTLFSMPTNWGSPSDRIYPEQVMAEEMTRMLRGWSRFDPLYQQNVRLFVDEGVGFGFFEDDFVWKWDIIGLQDIVFPRRVKADVNELDICVAQRQLLPYKLYEKCHDDGVCAAEGWNREATWEAIKTAAQPTLKANDFQQWEMAWKNHDYILGQTPVTVEVIEGWVREVDGTVSHYIARSDGEGDFLYKKEGKYSDMSHMLVPFLYGIGANGTFHAIHGVLQKTFAAGMAQNKIICRLVDMAVHASTPYLQCTTEEALEELPLTPLGQYVGMASGYNWVETKTPDFEQSLLPLIQQLSSLLSARSGPYTQTLNSTTERPQQTKYSQQSADEAQAKLSSSGITLFKNGLRMLYMEVVRRVIQPNYPQSWTGGAEVHEFISRCLDRGVTIEAIRQVDVKRIEVNMGIGRGSSAARRVAADALNTLYPRADAKGQNIINRIVAGSYAGASIGNEVFPAQPGLRPPQDLEDANMENSSLAIMAKLQLPQSVTVLPTQNHAIHLQSHIQFLGQMDQGLSNQQISLSDAIVVMEPVMEHADQHLQLLDPTNPEKGEFISQLKQIREVVSNGAKELMAQQEKMQNEAMHNGPQSMGPGNENPQAGAAMSSPNTSSELPATLIAKTAQEEQKLQDMKVSTNLRIAESQKNDARQDALTAAKISNMGLPQGTVP